MEVGVFSYQNNVDRLEETVLLRGELLPLRPCSLSPVHQRFRFGNAVEIEDVADGCNKALSLE